MSENKPKLPPDIPEHLAVWATYNQRALLEEALAKGAREDVLRRALDALPEVSALDALTANHAAVDLLIGRRWIVMRAAREAGATWEAIGGTLGITEEGARDYYRREIEEQEKYVSQFHDAARAREALDGGTA